MRSEMRRKLERLEAKAERAAVIDLWDECSEIKEV